MISAIVFLPLIASIIVGLTTSSISVKKAQFITIAAVATAAILSWNVFYHVILEKEVLRVVLLPWLRVGSLSVDWVLLVDSLTAVMLVLVTTVSALVHIYSVGYMSHDPHPQRFMSYLSLFTFSMLMLVTSDNFLQLFFGWEGVGLCSYLLIGFWYKKDSAKAAAMKAFIVNRVGDFGLLLGVLTIYITFKSLSFSEVFAIASVFQGKIGVFFGLEVDTITLICILLFIGAMGKSAQLGLHTWLPDAMEGPTPVSALIHAATMVTAGVFLVARCSPLFELSDVARNLVTLVGGATALFAATIAVTQNDIKRVIAYSTCSQLGYMFFACGVSAYAAGVFHLLTHGFFKALLFLSAGSVIHAMSDEQDMRNMGGIRKKIPVTYAMMLIGTVAIVGFPPLSGYFSKDMILESAYAAGHHGQWSATIAFWLGASAALLTSFYSWRLIFMTFHGTCRAEQKVQDHIHESPKVMTFPLMVLAFGAIFAGMYFSQSLGIVDSKLSFWNHSITMLGKENVLHAAHHVPSWVKFAPMVAGILGLLGAYLAYIKYTKLPAYTAQRFSFLYRFLYNKWYIDELYDLLFVRPAKWIGSVLWKVCDVKLIDRLGPNGTAWVAIKCAAGISKIQNGLIYSYAFVILLGLIGILGYILLNYIG